MKLKVLFILVISTVSFVHGQTVKDFENKYGRPINAYSLSDFIWVTPSFARDGTLCQMLVYPKRFGNGATNLFDELPSGELQISLDKLVPVSSRGKRKDPFVSAWTGGGAMVTTYVYENITIIFFRPLKLAPEKSKPYTLAVPPSDVVMNDEPIEVSMVYSNVSIATIKWNDRDCTGN